jgi:hypothetical protein
MKLASKQPQPGDKVAFCPHYGQHKYWQWYAIPGGRELRNQTGKSEQVAWAVSCIDCLNAAGGNVLKVKFGGVGTWQGHGAAIVADSDSS